MEKLPRYTTCNSFVFQMAERNKLSKAQTFQEQYNIDTNSLLVFIVEKSFLSLQKF